MSTIQNSPTLYSNQKLCFTNTSYTITPGKANTSKQDLGEQDKKTEQVPGKDNPKHRETEPVPKRKKTWSPGVFQKPIHVNRIDTVQLNSIQKSNLVNNLSTIESSQDTKSKEEIGEQDRTAKIPHQPGAINPTRKVPGSGPPIHREPLTAPQNNVTEDPRVYNKSFYVNKIDAGQSKGNAIDIHE